MRVSLKETDNPLLQVIFLLLFDVMNNEICLYTDVTPSEYLQQVFLLQKVKVFQAKGNVFVHTLIVLFL